MKEKIIYRIIPIAGLVIFAFNFVFRIYLISQRHYEFDFAPTVFLFLNVFGIIAFAILCVKPMKFEIYGVFSFLYSITMISYDTNIILATCICLLSIACFYSRGYFNKHPFPKLIIITVVFVGLFCARLRFGVENIIGDSLILLAFLLVLAVCFIILYPTKIQPALESFRKDIVDFSQYKELSDDDKKLISEVLQSKRYKEMAIDRHISESVIKKRMQAIFKILDVPDLNGFLVKFSNRNIVGLDAATTQG